MAKNKRKKESGTAGIISLGCSKNLVDTEFLMGRLADEGYGFSPLFEEADLVIVNTCGFLDASVEESRGAIEEALQWKRDRGGTVVVAGCLVNRARRELEERFPEVDLFLHPGAIDNLPSLLSGSEASGRAETEERSYLPPGDAGRVLTASGWAYLKISDGCDNRCSYCLIPGLRGGHRSRTSEEIVGEARSLIEAGVREINLVGQDLTRWRERGTGARLTELVREISVLPGAFRLRLLYLHPSRIDRELADTIAETAKVFPYLDLPIQHANDEVLRGMNRPYGRRALEDLYRMLRDTIPGVALRTTVMTGFPGEGEKEFAELMSFLRACPFENLGAFVFSPEKGTPAYDSGGRVDPAVAGERYEQILEQQQALSAELWKRRTGSVTEALVLEGCGEDGCSGRTAWQAPEVDGGIVLKGDAAPGDLVLARITDSGRYDLEGLIEELL
jgi:ribosomal protein S12 methylthiotransferase